MSLWLNVGAKTFNGQHQETHNDAKDKLLKPRMMAKTNYKIYAFNKLNEKTLNSLVAPFDIPKPKFANLKKKINRLAKTWTLPFSCIFTNSLPLLCHWRKSECFSKKISTRIKQHQRNKMQLCFDKKNSTPSLSLLHTDNTNSLSHSPFHHKMQRIETAFLQLFLL